MPRLLQLAHDDIWVLDLASGGAGAGLKATAWLQTPFAETSPQFSPDGRWVAYQSRESGRNEVYVALFSNPGVKRQVSTTGGQLPRWRKDGKEIFYLSLDDQLVAADISEKAGTMDVGLSHTFFHLISTGGFDYDVSADGQRLLAVVPADPTGDRELTVVQNWTAGLKK